MPMLIYAATSPPSGMTTDTCDMCLVAAAKNGDHQAYAELCRRHSQRTLRTVLRITRNIADAEDTLQEALLKAYTHIGEFDGRSAFSSWLTRIAINVALMLLRKRRSKPVTDSRSIRRRTLSGFLNLLKLPTIPKNPAFRVLWRMNWPKRFDICRLAFGL
jgi:DNA-directed RNA polymerase specialized sigma24 family protein